MLHKAWRSIEEVPYCFRGYPSNFMVTRVEKFMIWIQFEITRPVAAIKSLRFALWWWLHMGHAFVMMVTYGTPYCDDGYNMGHLTVMMVTIWDTLLWWWLQYMGHLTVMMVTNGTPYCDDGYNMGHLMIERVPCYDSTGHAEQSTLSVGPQRRLRMAYL